MDKILLIDAAGSVARLFSEPDGIRSYETVVLRSWPDENPVTGNHFYDLILIHHDQNLTDSIAILANLKKGHQADTIHVIVIFDDHDKDLINGVIRLGANDYVCGELSAEMLRLKVSNALKLINAEKESKARRPLLQEIIDCIPIVTLIVDSDVRIIGANNASSAFAGKPASKIMEKLGGNALGCLETLAGGCDCGSSDECRYCVIRTSVRHTINTGEAVYKREGKFMTGNNSEGSALEILVSTTLLTLEGSKAVLLTVDDITKYRQALREMQEARDQFAFQAEELSQLTEDLDFTNTKLYEEKETINAIFNSSNIGICITDTAGRFVLFNDWWTEQLGYSAEEMRRLTNLEVTHPDDVAASEAWFRKIINGETDRYCLDKKFVRKDGSFFWADLSTSVVRDGKKRVTNVIGIVRDITYFKEATEALLRSEIALREAQRIGNTAHWEYEIESRKVSLSEQLYAIFELDPDNFVPTIDNMLSLLHENERQGFKESYYASVRDKAEMSIEYGITTVSGKNKFLTCRARTRYDRHGAPVFTFGTITDITERKEIELQIARQNEELKELNATKDKFFSIISHDLRNAFGAIMNLSDLLVTDFGAYSSAELKEYISMISSTSKSTYSLLQNLLEWARAQQGRITFNPGMINLRSITGDCIGLFVHNTQIKELAVVNRVDDSLLLYADKDMMKTIIRNLISNAIKFTPRKGSITIEATAAGEMAEIAVHDTGVGMDAATRDSLFKIANTTSVNGTEGEKGTGLGLVLCREFITKQSGEIWVESMPGEGSTFRFTVPLFRQQPSTTD